MKKNTFSLNLLCLLSAIVTTTSPVIAATAFDKNILIKIGEQKIPIKSTLLLYQSVSKYSRHKPTKTAFFSRIIMNHLITNDQLKIFQSTNKPLYAIKPKQIHHNYWLALSPHLTCLILILNTS